MFRTFTNLLNNERTNIYLGEFKERRYVMNWEPQLNLYR